MQDRGQLASHSGKSGVLYISTPSYPCLVIPVRAVIREPSSRMTREPEGLRHLTIFPDPWRPLIVGAHLTSRDRSKDGFKSRLPRLVKGKCENGSSAIEMQHCVSTRRALDTTSQPDTLQFTPAWIFGWLCVRSAGRQMTESFRLRRSLNVLRTILVFPRISLAYQAFCYIRHIYLYLSVCTQ